MLLICLALLDLLSLGSLAKQGCVACFDEAHGILISLKTTHILAHGVRSPRNGLYQLVTDSRDIYVNYVATVALDQTRLWHCRMAHMNYQNLHILNARRRTKGLPYIPVPREVYQACQLGKQHKELFPNPLEQLGFWSFDMTCQPLSPNASSRAQRQAILHGNRTQLQSFHLGEKLHS